MTRIREYFTATGRKLSADEKSAVSAVKAKYAGGVTVTSTVVRQDNPKRTTTMVGGFVRTGDGRVHQVPRQAKPAKAA